MGRRGGGWGKRDGEKRRGEERGMGRRGGGVWKEDGERGMGRRGGGWGKRDGEKRRGEKEGQGEDHSIYLIAKLYDHRHKFELTSK